LLIITPNILPTTLMFPHIPDVLGGGIKFITPCPTVKYKLPERKAEIIGLKIKRIA
jgi:hypothetical protein